MQLSKQTVFTAPQTTYADTASLLSANHATGPRYLFSRKRLVANYRQFLQGFPGLVTYAVKANPHPLIMDTLINAGMNTFDVASLHEIQLVRNASADAICHFNNPIKSEESIHSAYWHHGVRSFAVDDESEFNKILRATGYNKDIEISVRFALPVMNAEYDFGSKFGCDPGRASNLLKTVKNSGFTPSLTFHPGSQCEDPHAYHKYIGVADRIVEQSGIELARLNMGGGFPITYGGRGVPSLSNFFLAIKRGLRDTQNLKDTPLICEPGRALVGNTTSLLCGVIHRRHDGSVFLNDGVYGGLSEQSVTELVPVHRCFTGSTLLSQDLKETKTFGPTCDPLDRLGSKLMLPAALDVGDHVEFASMGAYGSAATTGFNGFKSDQYELVNRPYMVD